METSANEVELNGIGMMELDCGGFSSQQEKLDFMHMVGT